MWLSLSLSLSQGICQAPSRLSMCHLRRPACIAALPQTSWEQRTATSTCPSTAVNASLFTHNPLCLLFTAATWMTLNDCFVSLSLSLSLSLQPRTAPRAYCRACCWPCPWAWCCWRCWCSCCGSAARDRTGGGGRGKRRRRSVTMRYGTLRLWWSARLFDFSTSAGIKKKKCSNPVVKQKTSKTLFHVDNGFLQLTVPWAPRLILHHRTASQVLK